MTCPHCSESVTYKERMWKKCSKCKNEFAFEPKTDTYALHDLRFRKVCDKLSGNGRFFFTPSQLQQAVAKKTGFNNVKSFLGLIPLTFFIAVVFIIFGFSFWLVCGVAALVIAVTMAIWILSGPRKLPSSEEFNKQVLQRWMKIYGALPPNLVTNANVSAIEPPQTATAQAVLICPDDDILLCLSANGVSKNLNLLLLNPLAGATERESETLRFVQQNHDLPILILHDASASGCLLREEFARMLKINPLKRQIVDLGLRPNVVMRTKFRFSKQAKLDAATVARLNAAQLAPDEINWLAEGNFVTLAALPPSALINFVTRGTARVRQSQTAPPQTPSPEKIAESVGFMTQA